MFHRKKKYDPKGEALVNPGEITKKAEKTAAAVLKAAKEARRTARHGERDVDKELRNLERSEKSLVADIKKTAKTGNQAATRTLAKQLVGLRNQKQRLMTARARITGVGYAASSAATQASLAGVMGNVTGVMQQVNNAVSTEETAKIMQQFALQNEKMAMSEDMMNDALIDAFDGEGVEEEANGVVDQVLAEIGLDIDGRMVDAPTNAPAIAKPEAKTEDEIKLDSKTEQLLAQLDAL